MRPLHSLCLVGALYLAACSPDADPTDPSPGPAQTPSLAISDAAHGGTAHFFFTAPLVADPVPTGAFDPTAQPTVEVCEWTGAACGPVVAAFTRTSGTGGETIHLDQRGERYFSNWNTTRCVTGPCTLDPALTYRIRVLIGGLEAGFADLDVVATKGELGGVDTAQFVPLQRGKQLKIAFRIEQGLVVQPPDPGTIAGTVSSATRGALAGVTVRFQPSGLEATTDAAGAYTRSVPPGAVTVSLSGLPAGCTEPAGQPVTLPPGGSAQVDFTVTCTLLPPTPASLGAGIDFTCQLRGGATRCWGSNQFGKLGDGTTVAFNPTPTTVINGGGFTTIALGYHHVCALAPDATASCWGLNGSGTLGDGTTTSRPTPTPVVGGLTFGQITADEFQTCAVTLTAVAYCWGLNLFGQLGNPSVGQSTSPLAVQTALAFHSLAAGDGHTCGLTPLGAAFCWGQNTSGQLGDGTTTNRATPVAVQGGLTFVQLTAGDLHTCGLTQPGQAYCWGLGTQLGAGTAPVDQPTPIAVAGGLVFRSIAAGAGHTCGVTADGSAWCWGNILSGLLGQARDDSTVPVAVTGDHLFTELAGGARHTCGLTPSGETWCWGDNTFGELGNGTSSQTPSPSPVQVDFGT